MVNQGNWKWLNKYRIIQKTGIPLKKKLERIFPYNVNFVLRDESIFITADLPERLRYIFSSVSLLEKQLQESDSEPMTSYSILSWWIRQNVTSYSASPLVDQTAREVIFCLSVGGLEST